jgi:hypothetical protein
MNVGNWLRKLGLERYEPAFRENKVTGKILPKLTAEDLKDLGVVLVGDRRLLLDAIGFLSSEAEPCSPNLPDIGEQPSDGSPAVAHSAFGYALLSRVILSLLALPFILVMPSKREERRAASPANRSTWQH